MTEKLPTCSRYDGAEREDHQQQVAGEHVGEEPDGEGERPDHEGLQQLDRRQQDQRRRRHARREAASLK